MDSEPEAEKPDEVMEKLKQVVNDQDDSVKSANIEKNKASAIETIGRIKEDKDYIVKARNFVDANIKTPYKIKDFFKTNNLSVGEEDIDDLISVIISVINDTNTSKEDKDASQAAYTKLVDPLTDHYKSEDMKKTKRYVDYGKDFTKKEQREINIHMDKINIKDEGYKIKEKERLIEAAEEKRQQELMSERLDADKPSIGIKILPAVPLNVVNTELDLGAVVNYFNGFQGLDLETIFKASKKYSSAQKDKLDHALVQLREKLPRGIDYTDEELEKALLKQKLDINETINVLGLDLEKKLKNNYVRRNRKREKLNKELAETEKKLREATKSNDKSLEKKLMERKEDIKKTLEKTIKEQEEESKSDAAKEQAKKWAEKAHKNEKLLKEHFKEHFPDETVADALKKYLYVENAGDDTENERKLQNLIDLEMKRKEAVMYKKQSKDESDALAESINYLDRQIKISETKIETLTGKLNESEAKVKSKQDKLNNEPENMDLKEEVRKLNDTIEGNQKAIEQEEEKLRDLKIQKKSKQNEASAADPSDARSDSATKEKNLKIQKKSKHSEASAADLIAARAVSGAKEETSVGGKKTRNNVRSYLKKTRRKRV